MTTISDLHQSISDMSPEAQYNLIRELRALRRIPKDKPVRKTSTKKSKKPKEKQLTLDQMLNNMSPEQAKKLLTKLQTKGSK